MSATFVSQETAQWAIHWYVMHTEHADYLPGDIANTGRKPPAGVHGLLMAAYFLEDRARAQLELAFPEIVAAADLMKSHHGLQVLRAIATNGVPTG